MRILQVVHGFPPNEWAGTELITCYLSQALQAKGHEVTVFTRTGNTTASAGTLLEEEYAGLPVLRVVSPGREATHFALGYDNPFLNKVFLSVLQRLQPHVVHVQHVQHLSISMIRVAAALGYPTVLSLHDFYFPCQRIHLLDAQEQLCAGPERGERCVPCLQSQAPADAVRRRFVQMEQALNYPQVVTTPSRFLADKMQSYFPGLGDRLRTLPLGVKRPEGISQERRPRPAGAPLRILYVGVLLPHKGAHVLLEALNGIPIEAVTVSLYGTTVVGKENYTMRLHATAKGLPVQFHDAYTHDQFGHILMEHDVLVMPMVWEETFSLLTREAFLAGLPVVAARRGALTEAVQDGVNGLLFEPENPTDLRRCLMRLVTEPGLLEQLRSAGPPVKTIETYAQEIEALYHEFVSQQQQPSLEHCLVEASAAETTVVPGKSLTPQVSVCIPTYNGARFLAEAIGSVLTQSFQDLELLIVDDGSSDETLEIARSFSDARLRIHHNEKRLGIPGNWNQGVALARGEYICIFHQDDVMMPENLACKVRILQTDPTVSFVHSAAEVVVEENAPSLLTLESATTDGVVDGPAYFRQLLLQGNRICAPTVLARRQALRAIGLFDETLGFTPDYAAWMCLCLEGRVAFLSQPLVQYRWHEGNASHQYHLERGGEEILAAGEKALQYYSKRTGRPEEGGLLREALTVTAKLREEVAALYRGQAWLEAQWVNWQRTAEAREKVIAEQKEWIAGLEQGKNWLTTQKENWQQIAEQRESSIQALKEWIGQLEKHKAALREEVEQLRSSWIPYVLLKRILKNKTDDEGKGE